MLFSLIPHAMSRLGFLVCIGVPFALVPESKFAVCIRHGESRARMVRRF